MVEGLMPTYYWLENNIRNLPDNFERYGDFKTSNGRGMRSTEAILFMFDRDISFIVIHHPARFNYN